MNTLLIKTTIKDLSERSGIQVKNISTYLKHLVEDELIVDYKINKKSVTIEINSTLELLFNGNLNETEPE